MPEFGNFTMRPSQIGDIPRLTSIICGVFDEYGWIFVAQDELPDFVDFATYYSNPNQARLFTIEERSDGKMSIVGCIGLKVNAEGAYLSRVYLDKSVRGKGLGKYMVLQTLKLAREDGFTSVHLWTDTRFTDAHGLYERIGFTHTGDLRSLHDTNKSFEWKYRISLE